MFRLKIAGEHQQALALRGGRLPQRAHEKCDARKINLGPLLGRGGFLEFVEKSFRFRQIFSIPGNVRANLQKTRQAQTRLPCVRILRVARKEPTERAFLFVEMTKRGSYNALGAAIQQVSGGIASVIAGHIVTMAPDGKLEQFPVVGYVVVCATLTAMVTTWKMKQGIERHAATSQPAAA